MIYNNSFRQRGEAIGGFCTSIIYISYINTFISQNSCHGYTLTFYNLELICH